MVQQIWDVHASTRNEEIGLSIVPENCWQGLAATKEVATPPRSSEVDVESTAFSIKPVFLFLSCVTQEIFQELS